MGMETKYTGVPVDTSAALEVQGSIPIATAVDNQNEVGQLASAKVNKGLESNEREDGITITWEKGEVQPSQYRDKSFAILFLVHLVGGKFCACIILIYYMDYLYYFMSNNFICYIFSTGFVNRVWSFCCLE